jgi:hypothetical protein
LGRYETSRNQPPRVCSDIQYDLLQVTAEQIADKLELIGTQLGGGLMDRLKLAFIDFQEEAEISRLEVEDNQHSH